MKTQTALRNSWTLSIKFGDPGIMLFDHPVAHVCQYEKVAAQSHAHKREVMRSKAAFSKSQV